MLLDSALEARRRVDEHCIIVRIRGRVEGAREERKGGRGGERDGGRRRRTVKGGKAGIGG